MRQTAVWLRPVALANERVLQCVASAGGGLQGGGDRLLNLFVGDLARRPGPGLIQQPAEPALGEAPPPECHRRTAHPERRGDTAVRGTRFRAGEDDASAGGKRLPRLPAAHPAL
jgi:hypothetical protein